MVINKYSWILILTLLINSCTTVQHISKTDVKYTVVSSDSSINEDEEINTIIAPYKVQLDAVMNEELAVLPAELAKKKPESPLGNWVTDAIVDRLRKDNYPVDFAVVNYGGLRIPYLTAGSVTRGKVFELAPFDNTIMVVEVPGIKLDSFFLLVAEADGWPVSKEVKLVISNKKLISAQIAGEPIDRNKTYKMATLDYVATGGDDMKVLIPLLRKETGLIFRDVLIDHLKQATAAGIPVTAAMEGRIISQ
ncbi:MAG TPA: 5'-nucleotidase C-terminal domain-containing protein [Saprospiraceae bacterium]|nr:5'-nucleotidase C-terminal domain-containing protein [Saprospiraceae bacterium]